MRVAVGETATIVVQCPDAVTAATATAVAIDGTVPAPPTATPSGSTVTVTLDSTWTTELNTWTVTVASTFADGTVQVDQVSVEVVGGHWLSVTQLRSEQGLDDKIRFPDWLIADVRDEWADYLDDICGRAFTPRVIRESHPPGQVVVRHPDPRKLVAAWVDGTKLGGALPTVSTDGVTTLVSKRGATVLVEVGWDHPPAMLVREARKAIGRELLMRSAVSPNDRISETFGEGGTIRYSTPDPRAGRWTGMLSLDPAITQYQAARAGFA